MSFRIVSDGFWTDPDIHILNTFSTYLFMYLITNSHAHLSGIYYLPLLFIEEETKLTQKEIKRCLDTLSTPPRHPHVTYDYDLSIVWITKMLARQPSKGPSIITNIEEHLLSLHKCPLIKPFLEFYKELNLKYPHPLDTLSTPPRHPVEVLETDTQTETETKTETTKTTKQNITELKTTSLMKLSEHPYFYFTPEDLKTLWNKTLGSNGLQKCSSLNVEVKLGEGKNAQTKTRLALLTDRLKERRCPSYWMAVLQKIEASDWLMRREGQKDKVTSIDFIARPNHHFKVIEGEYDNKRYTPPMQREE